MSVAGYDSSVVYTGAVIQVNIYPEGVKASGKRIGMVIFFDE